MTVKEIERQIKKLPRARLIEFRDWFKQFESDKWDRQIERDVRSGKLAHLAKEARADYKTGKTKEI